MQSLMGPSEDETTSMFNSGRASPVLKLEEVFSYICEDIALLHLTT